MSHSLYCFMLTFLLNSPLLFLITKWFLEYTDYDVIVIIDHFIPVAFVLRTAIKFLILLKKFFKALNTITILIQVSVLKNFIFLPRYYSRNENLWVDGFILDFLQKKSADLLIRKFVIYTGFIFSERLIFDSIVRIYLDNILWPAHYNGLFEANNVLEMLSTNIFFYFYFFGLVTLSYICFF